MPVTTQDLVADLMAAFPRQRIEAGTVRVYLAALQGIPVAALQDAVLYLVDTVRFFPSVAEIKEVVAERTLALPTEAEALHQIEERTRWARDGATGDPPAVHPLVRSTLDRVGGWHAFKASDNPAVVVGQFGRLYREERAGAVRALQTTRLALPAAPDPEGRSA